MISKQKLLLPVFCVIIFALGYHLGGLQLALLRSVVELGFSKAMIGLPITMICISGIIIPLIFGPLSDKIGKKYIIAAFMLVFIIGSFITYSQYSRILFILSMFIIGAGTSIIEVLVTALITDIFKDKSEQYINLSQSFFCVGAVISPMILHMFMEVYSASWRTTFLINVILTALIIPFFLIISPNTITKTTKVKIPEKAGNRLLLLGFVLCMFIYVGVEGGISFFADSLYVIELNIPIMGAYAISLFWAAMGVGRFVFGKMKKIPKNATSISFLLITTVMICIALVRQEFILLCLFAIAGLMCSCVWPGVTSFAVSLNKNESGRIISYLNLGTGLGGASIPFLMGVIMDYAGLRYSFLIFAVLPLIAGIYLLRITKILS